MLVRLWGLFGAVSFTYLAGAKVVETVAEIWAKTH